MAAGYEADPEHRLTASEAESEEERRAYLAALEEEEVESDLVLGLFHPGGSIKVLFKDCVSPAPAAHSSLTTLTARETMY